MARRFLTRDTIDDLIAEGRTSLDLGPDDVVTHHARDHARSKGFRLVPAGEAAQPTSATPPMPSTAAPTKAAAAAATGSDVTREQVRAAVVAALGRVPDGLDDIIDKAMRD